jgi:hypothetical protein
MVAACHLLHTSYPSPRTCPGPLGPVYGRGFT